MKLVLTVILLISAMYFMSMSINFTSELIMSNLCVIAIISVILMLWVVFKIYKSMQIEDSSVCIQFLDD